MSDLDKTLAAAREVYIAEGAKFVELDEKDDPIFSALGALIRDLDAARSQPVAWRYVAEDGYSSFQLGPPTDVIRKRYKGWTPLFTAPPAAPVDGPAFLAKLEAIPLPFNKMLECIGESREWSDIRFVARRVDGGFEFRSASVNVPHVAVESKGVES